jgi:hypothetical protein
MECNDEMSVSPVKNHINWWTLLWTFPLHQIISTVGVLLLATVLTESAVSPSTARWILGRMPYFPVPVALGFINGFFWQRRLGHRVMQWVWVLPFLMLCLPYVFDRSYPLSERFARPLGAPCEPTVHCVALRGYESAFCTAVSYSLGAFLSRIERHIKKEMVPEADTRENS